MRETFVAALAVFSLVVTTYFVCWNTTQVLMSPMAGLFLWRHRHRGTGPGRSRSRTVS